MESSWFSCVQGMVKEAQGRTSPAPDRATVHRGFAFGQADLRGDCPSSGYSAESLGGERRH